MDADPSAAATSGLPGAFLPPPPPLAAPPLPPPPPGYPPAMGHAGPTAPTAPVLPPVSAEVLAIPLGIRDLLRQSLDLLTRTDSGLRSASFYIGLMMLVTVSPAIVLLGLGLTSYGDTPFDFARSGPPDWMLWTILAAIPAYLGYLAAATEARVMATAVIGGRVEGRPLRLRESIAIARRRFWRILGVQLLFGVLSASISFVLGLLVLALMGPVLFISDSVSLVVALAVGMPFVYAPSSVILGEVGVVEAIRRSIRLVRVRARLAVVVTLFGVFGQFIVLFGLSAGLDVVGRLLEGSGITEDFPKVLLVPIIAAFVFALGTLTFLVEAIAAAPAVHAFEALTHYTHGLEVGRRNPVEGTRPWNPWFTKGLALSALVAFGALVGGVLSLG